MNILEAIVLPQILSGSESDGWARQISIHSLATINVDADSSSY